MAVAFDDASGDEDPAFFIIWTSGILLRLLLILGVVLIFRSRFIIFAFLVNILPLLYFPASKYVWTW